MKETPGKLLILTEKSQKKYFTSLSEIKHQLRILVNNYSSDFKEYQNVEYICLDLKIDINMFLYSVTEVSVGGYFKQYENIELIHSLLQFKTL
jgi:hypothetical protein